MPKLLFQHLVVPEPPRGPVPQQHLPQFRYPPIPAVWVLEESTDLTNWHKLVHFESLPMQPGFTAPKVGSRFFRVVGTAYPPAGFHANKPYNTNDWAQ